MKYILNCLKILGVTTFVLLAINTMHYQVLASENYKSEVQFTDIKNHFAEDSVNRWSKLGVIKGYNNQFLPNQPIKRGDFAVILDRLLKYQAKNQNKFEDLGSEYFADALLKANNKEVFQGYNGKIEPYRSITRQEAAIVLYRAFGLDKNSNLGLINNFQDSSQVQDWAKPAMNSLLEAGFIKGNNQNLYPNESITRAELAVILDRMIDQVITKEGIVDYSNNSLRHSNKTAKIIIIQAPNVTLQNLKENKKILVSEACDNGKLVMKDSEKVDLLLYPKYENLMIEIDNSELKHVNLLGEKDNKQSEMIKKIEEIIPVNNGKITKSIEIKTEKDGANPTKLQIDIQDLATSDKHKPSFGKEISGEEVKKPAPTFPDYSYPDYEPPVVKVSKQLKDIILVTDYTRSDYKIYIPKNKVNEIEEILGETVILADRNTGEISILPATLEYLNLKEVDFNSEREHQIFAEVKNDFQINETIYKAGTIKIIVVIEE